MYDKELVIEILQQILMASKRILSRFAKISSVGDFLKNEEGIEKLDAICMQLIAIGESLKNIDRITNGELLKDYHQVDWKRAKGMRDIISHHYFDLDAEIIYDVCENEIPKLKATIEKILNDLKNK